MKNNLKYVNTQVTFSEIPDEISLCINISNCIHKCKGCHSPYLQKDIGNELNPDVLDILIKENQGITCVCFMGYGADPYAVISLLRYIKLTYPNLKTALYTGDNEIEVEFDIIDGMFKAFCDYIKYGEYIAELGGLDNPNTNQVMYKLEWNFPLMEKKNMNWWFQNKNTNEN